MNHRISILSAAMAIAFAGVAIVPATGLSAPKKSKLTDEQKEEVKLATEALKGVRVYHKARLTRLFNSGSKEELLALPGIGEKTLERIIAGRPYETSAHVVLVKGIGVETFKKIVEAKK